jgi:hypothetical protein
MVIFITDKVKDNWIKWHRAGIYGSKASVISRLWRTWSLQTKSLSLTPSYTRYFPRRLNLAIKYTWHWNVGKCRLKKRYISFVLSFKFHNFDSSNSKGTSFVDSLWDYIAKIAIFPHRKHSRVITYAPVLPWSKSRAVVRALRRGYTALKQKLYTAVSRENMQLFFSTLLITYLSLCLYLASLI